MKTKRIVFLLLTLLLSLLSGCTYEADRIYTVCKYTETETYCYKDSDNFYKVLDDGALVKVSGVGLKAKPALHLIPDDGEYVFEEQLPGLYKGTLESVNAYAHKLLNDGSTYEIVSADANILEIVVSCNEYSVRIIYNIRGDVRIYAIDDSSNSINPPYINEE